MPGKPGNYKKAYDLESSEYRKATSFDLYNERLKGSSGNDRCQAS